MSPVATPLSMMSALRLGRYSEAIVPKSCSSDHRGEGALVRLQVDPQQGDQHKPSERCRRNANIILLPVIPDLRVAAPSRLVGSGPVVR